MPSETTIRWSWGLIVATVAAVANGTAVAAAMPPPATTVVPAGPFIAGSDRAEREQAYRLDEQAYGHSITREQRWYEGEMDRQTAVLQAFLRLPMRVRIIVAEVVFQSPPGQGKDNRRLL